MTTAKTPYVGLAFRSPRVTYQVPMSCRVSQKTVAAIAPTATSRGRSGSAVSTMNASRKSPRLTRAEPATPSTDAPAPWATAVAKAASAVEETTARPSRPITPKVRAYRFQKLGQRTCGIFQTVFIAFCDAKPMPKLPYRVPAMPMISAVVLPSSGSLRRRDERSGADDGRDVHCHHLVVSMHLTS